jgi:NTP pyrophosphatase (non-canonical NTP hydrolase)
MDRDGLTKLMEEAGEVIQVAAKLSAYPEETHPELIKRLQNELADLQACINFVVGRWGLDSEHINKRTSKKLKAFTIWNKERAKIK